MIQQLEEQHVVQAAYNYAQNVMPMHLEGLEIEAIERAKTGEWLVTIGYWQKKPKSLFDEELEKSQQENKGIVLRIPSTEVTRVFKVLTIDPNGLKVLSMKIPEHE